MIKVLCDKCGKDIPTQKYSLPAKVNNPISVENGARGKIARYDYYEIEQKEVDLCKDCIEEVLIKIWN